MVTGGEYPAPDLNQLMASALTFFQFAMFALILAGSSIFQKIGMQTPEFVAMLEDKKMMACMLVFLVGNMIRSSLLSTGAFEIYFDDELVFSKLQTNQIPTSEIINNLFRRYEVV